jgi:hypothetical protein
MRKDGSITLIDAFLDVRLPYNLKLYTSSCGHADPRALYDPVEEKTGTELC